jgi:hypothetical protein
VRKSVRAKSRRLTCSIKAGPLFVAEQALSKTSIELIRLLQSSPRNNQCSYIEAVTEIAVRDMRALPVVAGLAARSVIKNRGASMPPAQRQQVVNTMNRAAKTLVANGGQKAIRALPRITRSVKRTSAGSGTPPSSQPRIVARTAAKVARNPALLQRLSTPSPQGQALANGAMGGTMGRTISVPGPATLTINVG